jgi:hypothetical protein
MGMKIPTAWGPAFDFRFAILDFRFGGVTSATAVIDARF